VRTIVGIIGNSRLSNMIASEFSKNGFFRTSIKSKVKEVATYLLPINDSQKEFMIESLRSRAYNINKNYWINMLLSSVAKDNKKIIIEDLKEEDVIKDIKVYRISEHNIEEIKIEIKKEFLS